MASIIKATLATADEWRQFSASSGYEEARLVPADTFKLWVKLFGVAI